MHESKLVPTKIGRNDVRILCAAPEKRKRSWGRIFEPRIKHTPSIGNSRAAFPAQHSLLSVFLFTSRPRRRLIQATVLQNVLYAIHERNGSMRTSEPRKKDLLHAISKPLTCTEQCCPNAVERRFCTSPSNWHDCCSHAHCVLQSRALWQNTEWRTTMANAMVAALNIPAGA